MREHNRRPERQTPGHSSANMNNNDRANEDKNVGPQAASGGASPPEDLSEPPGPPCPADRGRRMTPHQTDVLTSPGHHVLRSEFREETQANQQPHGENAKTTRSTKEQPHGQNA